MIFEQPAYPTESYPGCPCYVCDQKPRIEAARTAGDIFRIYPNRLSLCPTCGDKRCPGAIDHSQHPATP